MKYTKYSRYSPDAADDIDLQELMSRMSDFFLQSGFDNQYGIYEMDMERSREQHMEQLREAILRALEEGDLVPPELMEQMLQNPDLSQNKELKDLIDQIIQRMEEEGLITQQQSARVTPPPSETPGGQAGEEGPKVEARFEITDKALDFLGFKTLKDLLASLGKSSFGRHDTRDLATGVESGGTSKPYEFGDTLNMDISATLFNAVRRTGSGLPIELDYPDLMVHQCEYQSSCATVLMLDCSHSMILYGEDRFTPAKRVALALSHLIRTQYPGDSLHCVLFHDSAEEIPIGKLARVQVGPYYTNTREGLRLAQRILVAAEKRHAADRDDHRRQAFGADARRRPHLQECVRARSAGGDANDGGSGQVQAGGDPDQYLHAGERLQPRPLRAKDHGALPRQGLLHDALHPGPVSADGLCGPEDAEHSLSSRFFAFRSCFVRGAQNH